MLTSWEDLSVGDKIKCLEVYMGLNLPKLEDICIICHFHYDDFGTRNGAYITDITGNIKYGWFSMLENWELVSDYQAAKPKEKIDWFRLNKEISGY